MRNHRSPQLRLLLPILFFASQLLLASRLSSQQSPQNPTTCPCTLRGTVLDSVTGNPIHGAFVQASTGSAWSVLTDSEGKFQMDALPAGPITLTAAKPGFLPADEFGSSASKSVSVQSGADAATASLKLTPEGVIFGQVTDENGEPLENFTVSVLSRNPMNLPLYPNPSQRVSTDDEGKFRIAGLHPGFYYVAIHATDGPALTSTRNAPVPQGFAPVFYPAAPDIDSAIPIKVLPGRSLQANLSLKREPFVQLSGTVHGYRPGQHVILNLQDSVGQPSPQQITFDASTGSFHTNWIPPATYTLTAQTYIPDSFDSARPFSFASQLVSAGSNSSGIHLVLQPTVDIPVVIRGFSPTDRQQEQSRRLLLLLEAEAHNVRPRSHIASPVAPASGAPSESLSMVIAGVEPGTYAVRAGVQLVGTYYLESATWGSTDLLRDPLVLNSSGAVPPIDVVVREGAATLSGSVVSRDQPTSAVVVVFSPDDRKSPQIAYARADGEFQLYNLAPGTYRVIALSNLTGLDLQNQDGSRSLASKAREITLAASQTSSLRLELTTVGE
jgi:uncharacterized protein (DUF2141 family)